MRTTSDLPQTLMREPNAHAALTVVKLKDYFAETKSGTPDCIDACLAALSSLACLVGLASLEGLRLVSFDKGFKQYSGVTSLALTNVTRHSKTESCVSCIARFAFSPINTCLKSS